MCGICGSINIGNESSIRRMTDLLKHRGPDAQGTIEIDGKKNRVYLGNTRLSIIDLTKAGNMPMQTEDQRFTITYNGECYNFNEIRFKLEDEGVRFRSRSDTEVILKAYATWGIESLDYFDGMYAIAIWDNLKEELILIRDRAGIKPLYYYHDGDVFVFASEIKSFFVLNEIRREPNYQSLALMAGFFWSPDPLTAFKDIHHLKPAHHLIFKDGSIDVTRYWRPKFKPDYYSDFTHAMEDLEDILRNSVERSLISDVPLGAFVGGLDSSLIGMIATRLHNNEFPFYTSTMPNHVQKRESRSDDLPYVQELTKNKNIPLFIHNISSDTAKLLPKMIWHLDEPNADPLHIQMYLMSKLARDNGSKVLLCGQGADELFLGYDRHRAMIYAERINRICPRLFLELMSNISRFLPVAYGNQGLALPRKLKRFLKSASLKPLQRFVDLYLFPRIENLKNVSMVWANHVDDAITLMIEKHRQFWDEIESTDILDKMSYTDTHLYLSGYNLFYSDKSSSAASIETRYPYLNREMMEFSFRIPSRWKVNGGEVKYILKKVSEKYLPKRVIYRKKVAFPGALRTWTREDWYAEIEKALLANPSGLWNKMYLKRILYENKSGKEDHAHFIWALLMVEIWHQTFINGKPKMIHGFFEK